MMFFWKCLLLCLCFILSIPLQAGDITEFVLPNGLKVVVKPDQRSPVVIFQVWYKVGSVDEQKGNTGISHMLEHLMCRGNKAYLLDEVHQETDSIGSRGNAYTSRDYTFYYHILAKKHLSSAFAMEAKRMKNLDVDKNDLEIEKNVIRQERLERINRDPYLKASNALYNIAFKNDGYQFPIIGLSADLDAMSLTQVREWHKNYYTPDNATLVVVGDIKPAEVFILAKKHFSAIKKKKYIANNTLITDEKKKQVSRFVMPENINVGMILLAFKVPSIKTSDPAWEAYALDVLAGWLESGIHSRLTETLVRDKQVANEVFVYYAPMNRKQSLFIIEASPAKDVSLQRLEQELVVEIQQIKQERISTQILQKVKNQMIATEIFEQDSMYTQARIIGQAESVGIPWSEDVQYINRIKAVTAQQINKVLQKYINLDKKFVVIQKSHNNKK